MGMTYHQPVRTAAMMDKRSHTSISQQPAVIGSFFSSLLLLLRFECPPEDVEPLSSIASSMATAAKKSVKSDIATCYLKESANHIHSEILFGCKITLL